ncbi:MAG: hypothetical protein O2839_07260 [Cyanobacteria bacterium]|nr:hypothetical protein [Cyanobacteriota bacterium]MDA1246944.1 hypothetical protein [Cyanobacteriota bacterium]
MGLITFLVAIAPPVPGPGPRAGAPLLTRADGKPFRYLPDDNFYALDFDSRAVQIELFEGWDREQEAFADRQALAFFSGPMYERHVDAGGREITVPLGDIKTGDRIWRGRNRTAARQRAFVGVRRDGVVDFGFGELTTERARRYDSFIGGLHSVYNDLEQPPAAYRGAYSISMGQQIRYYLPRIRMVIGLRPDGRMEVLMSRDGLTLEQTRSLARQRGLRAAYLPDHASKSRFIIPSEKGFSAADANWISGGATSFVHVPYLLRLSTRPAPLQGSLLAVMAARTAAEACGNPFQCGQTLVGQLMDRALAGFNRLMEQGVEPIARLIWAPRGPNDPLRASAKAPMREPAITADPLSLRLRQTSQAEVPDQSEVLLETLGLPADLPLPLFLPEGEELPKQDPSFEESRSVALPSEAKEVEPKAAEASFEAIDSATGGVGSTTVRSPLPGAPPPLPLP